MKKPTKLEIVSNASADVTKTQPPRRLGEHGLTFWNATLAEYQIDDIGGLEVLAQICATLDRLQSLAAEIDRDGPTIQTKHGLKEHPALRQEIQCRSFITRNLVRLGLNLEVVKPVGRPAGYSPS
jgi:Phage terminase, small subunit